MEKKNIEWIDNLRVLSALAVITVHVSAPYVSCYTCNHNWWQIGNILDSIVRFCVPIFLMISGALWLSDRAPASTFYKKKIIRLIAPFVFWSFVCYLFNRFYLEQGRDKEFFKNFYELFRKGELDSHFWYVYMLVGLFLVAPIFKAWVTNVSANEIRLYLIIWFAVLLYMSPLFDESRIVFELKTIYNFSGYLVLGYYLSHHIHSPIKKQKITGFILFIVGVLFTIIGTSIMSEEMNNFADTLYNYLSLNIVVASIGIFIWLKHFTISNRFFKNVISSVAKYSYGIYLSHTIVMFWLRDKWHWETCHPLIYIPCSAAICFLVSWGGMLVLSKIPYSKYYTG